jgi:hypothetical protein
MPELGFGEQLAPFDRGRPQRVVQLLVKGRTLPICHLETMSRTPEAQSDSELAEGLIEEPGDVPSVSQTRWAFVNQVEAYPASAAALFLLRRHPRMSHVNTRRQGAGEIIRARRFRIEVLDHPGRFGLARDPGQSLVDLIEHGTGALYLFMAPLMNAKQPIRDRSKALRELDESRVRRLTDACLLHVEYRSSHAAFS